MAPTRPLGNCLDSRRHDDLLSNRLLQERRQHGAGPAGEKRGHDGHDDYDARLRPVHALRVLEALLSTLVALHDRLGGGLKRRARGAQRFELTFGGFLHVSRALIDEQLEVDGVHLRTGDVARQPASSIFGSSSANCGPKSKFGMRSSSRGPRSHFGTRSTSFGPKSNIGVRSSSFGPKSIFASRASK